MTFINKQHIPSLDGLKQSIDYDYDSSNRKVTINDGEYLSLVSVYNVAANKMVYSVGNEDLSGTVSDNNLIYTNVVSGVSDTDELYILYKPKEVSENLDTLRELEKTNVNLKINNQLLSNAFDDEVTERDLK